MTADHPTPAERESSLTRLEAAALDAADVLRDEVAELRAELARRDAALADLTRQRDDARAQVREANALLADVDRDPTALAELYDRARRTVLRQRKLIQAAEAQLERQAPVIEAATRYELAWDQYASFTKHPGINEGQRIATKARAHQELLDAVRALGPVDPEATAAPAPLHVEDGNGGER